MEIMSRTAKQHPLFPPQPAADGTPLAPEADGKPPQEIAPKEKEIGGPKGPEPTRYGDWEVGGRCTDF